jgi:L-ascorbate metabolism protein UlaG (beta-lactamase superfamily)
LQSGEVSLLTNPTSGRLKADIVLRTLVPTNVVPPADEIVFPGEYEVKGIEVRGFGVEAESTEKFVKTVYLVTWEELRFVFLGHISRPLDSDLLEEFGEPDVLFVPTGEHFLSATDAAKLTKQLEPKVVIPSFSKRPEEFVKAFGAKAETLEKFVFKRKDIADFKGRAIVLEAKG